MYKLTKSFSYLFTFLSRSVRTPFKYLLLSVCFFLGACSHFEHHHHGDETMTSSHSDANTTLDKSLNIKLNDGKRWLMDAHTRSVISDMLERFSSLNLAQQNQQELTQLGDQLSQDLDKLIQGCTMEGDSHNALHEFLTSFIPTLEELKTTANVDSAEHVEQLLTEYQQYFE